MNMTHQFVMQHCMLALNKVNAKFHPTKALQESQIDIALKCYNAFGEEVEISFKETMPYKLTPYIYMLRLQLNSIESVT